MLDNLQIVMAMLEKVGMVALVVLAYRVIRHARFSIVRSSLAIGIVFSLGALITMFDPLVLRPGVLIDIRTVMVALSALFGGPLAVAITSIVTISMRIYIGGAGVTAGVSAVVVGAVIGLAYTRISGGRRDLLGLGILGFLLSLSTVLIVTIVLAPISLTATLPALVVRNLMGTMIIGYLLAMEDQREAEYLAYKREAERDPLTGLKNRRALEAFDRQLRNQSAVQLFSVLMIDIDRFKSINDTYGHAFGDIVLRRLAEVVVGRVRGFDLTVRYGGEEFCVIVREASLHNARRIAEDIRLQIMEERFQIEDQAVKVTVSVGIAQSDKASFSVFQVIDRADKALYDAKNSGRNCSCTYRPETERRKIVSSV